MSPEARATLREIVAIGRDGKEFYEYAEMVIAEPALRQQFARLALAKSEVIALAGRVPPSDAVLPGGKELRQAIRLELASLRPLLARPEPGLLLAELERLEEQLIGHYTWVLYDSTDQSTRHELRSLLPVLQHCRDELARTRVALGPAPASGSAA